MATPAACAGAHQVARYDDLIDEASGELERVEAQLQDATQQLLTLQAQLSQLSQDRHHAVKLKAQVRCKLDFADLAPQSGPALVTT